MDISQELDELIDMSILSPWVTGFIEERKNRIVAYVGKLESELEKLKGEK